MHVSTVRNAQLDEGIGNVARGEAFEGFEGQRGHCVVHFDDELVYDWNLAEQSVNAFEYKGMMNEADAAWCRELHWHLLGAFSDVTEY